MKRFGSPLLLAGMVLCLAGCQSPDSEIHLPRRATKSELNSAGQEALAELYAKTPLAKELAPKAKGILVFPGVFKAGLIIGGQFGNGVMFGASGEAVGYYNTTAASYGLQAGAQKYGYALFFMKDKALEYLNESEGWEIGIGPTVVVLDEGASKTLTTTTAKDDIYAFIFDQRGLMVGLGIQGSKITPIEPEP